MSEWKRVKFFELFSEPTKNGIYKTKEFHGHGAKIINMGEIFAYAFIGKQNMNRVELNGKERNYFLVNNGDLLFARRSLVESGAGKCSIVYGLSEETTFESSIIRVRLNERIANPLYYMYWMRSLKGRTAINGIVSGVNVKGIRSSDLRNIDVDFPPLDIQHRIATILSRYDSLIENYQKQINLLEESAQRLHKEWFIDLRFPGHENTKIVDGVPEGWEKKKIKDLVDFKSGYAFKSSAFVEKGKYKIVTIKNVKDGVFDGDNVSYLNSVPEKMPSHCILQTGDILLSLTGNVGRICMVVGDNYLLNQRVAKLESKFPAFTYCLFRHYDTFVAINNLANGAAQQNVSPIRIGEMDMLVANDKIMHHFEKAAENIRTNILNLFSQIHHLTEARDRLLPKLMNGEINV